MNIRRSHHHAYNGVNIGYSQVPSKFSIDMAKMDAASPDNIEKIKNKIWMMR